MNYPQVELITQLYDRSIWAVRLLMMPAQCGYTLKLSSIDLPCSNLSASDLVIMELSLNTTIMHPFFVSYILFSINCTCQGIQHDH